MWPPSPAPPGSYAMGLVVLDMLATHMLGPHGGGFATWAAYENNGELPDSTSTRGPH